MTDKTPEALSDRLRDEADQCRNDGADDIANLLDEAAEALSKKLRGSSWRPEPVSRLMRYTGASLGARSMPDGTRPINPAITTRDAIQVANWMQDQHQRIEELEKALGDALSSLDDYRLGVEFGMYDKKAIDAALALLSTTQPEDTKT